MGFGLGFDMIKEIEFILISGDNGSKNYDEPSMMRRDLIAKGIPKSKIFLDFAGFRTLDSVVRSKKIFGQKEITIISQPFHTERAIFIAENKEKLQCVVSKNDIPFGQTQNPNLWDYADGVDTIEFLKSL